MNGKKDMENPYTYNGNNKLIPSFVCYADILGFTDLSKDSLSKGQGDQFLNAIRGSLHRAYERIQDFNIEKMDVADFNYKVFTDNIVIGFPVRNFLDDTGEPELGLIFQILSEFQVNLAMDGYFVRGCVTFGNHYMDDEIVFGDAMLEAYEIESAGGPPRISISNKVKELVFRQIDYYSPKEFSPQYEDLLQDYDGVLFLNYLNQAFRIFPEGGVILEILDKHKLQVEKNLEGYINNSHIRQKYEWAAQYHNFICKEFADQYPASSNPDQSIENALASECAQKTLLYLIDIEEGTHPSRIDLLNQSTVD